VHEGLEQVELLGRELDLRVSGPHLPGSRIEAQLADLDDRRAVRRPAPLERA
jgi:hypothetical protein